MQDRRATALADNIGLLREALRRVLRERPFVIDAMVVLPDHLHAVWTLPPGDADYATRWRLLKGCFTQSLARAGGGLSRNTRGEYDLWQRRSWEHTIRDEVDLARHIDYIHYNPVKHGLVKHARDWPYSSFHRFVRRGLCSPDWAGSVVASDNGRFGE